MSLVFFCQEWLMADDPVQVKFECQEVNPPVKTAELCTFCLISGRLIDNENSSINVNKKSTMGFPTSHQPRLCVTANFPKLGFRYPNLSFFSEISTNNHH